MRYHQNERDALPGQPPKRPAKPDYVKKQCNRLKRHNEKSRQRNRNNIGQRAVKTGLVEMIQRNRRQDQLDHNTGQDQRRNSPRYPPSPSFLSPFGQPLHPGQFVQDNNRSDRSKAELKAGPGHRFWPEQQYYQRPKRNQSQRQRVASQRQRRKHQQRRNTGSDRRHLRPGEQGIGNRAKRSGGSRDQGHRYAQRRPRKQR